MQVFIQILSAKKVFPPSLVDISPVIQEKKLCKIHQCVFYYIYIPFKKGLTSYLNKPGDALCQSSLQKMKNVKS